MERERDMADNEGWRLKGGVVESFEVVIEPRHLGKVYKETSHRK